jgi:hypothetical protein
MFYQGMPAREFFCTRCLKIQRIYAVIGLTLLGLLLASFFAVALWLRSLR